MLELISLRAPDAVRRTGPSRSRIYQSIASGEIEAAAAGCRPCDVGSSGVRSVQV